jgi:hypothetical protein
MIFKAVFLVLLLLCFLLFGDVVELLVQNFHPILFLFYLLIIITIIDIIIIIYTDFNRTKYDLTFFPKTLFYSVKNGPFGQILERGFIIYLILMIIHLYLMSFGDKDYLYITKFLLLRGFFFFIFFCVFHFLLETEFWQEMTLEFEALNSPENKSAFLINLRKYQISILFLSFGSFVAANSLFEYLNEFIINFLATLSLIFSSLYVIQFIFYITPYVRSKKVMSSKSISFSVGGIRFSTNWANVKKGAVVCYECIKGFAAAAGSAEICYKLTHGGMNAMSPPRQWIMNQQFPDDRTKIWTINRIFK